MINLIGTTNDPMKITEKMLIVKTYGYNSSPGKLYE
jgi:hypothetical protein